MTGSLQIKNNTYYMVLNVSDNGSRIQKWIPTRLPVKGNKRKAEALLEETLEKYKTQERQLSSTRGGNGESNGPKDSVLVTDLIRD